MNSLKQVLARLADGGDLAEDEARMAFDIVMSGEASPVQLGGLLMALRVKGETVDEIVGAVASLRAHALRIEAPPGAIDTCGTGGDGSGSFNISTAAAFVIAACGVPVAKHGNRNLSSRSGSADVLTALGVDVDLPAEVVQRCLWEVGLGFMLAPRFHAATRHVAAARVEMGVRTIFNLLGPLCNPAGIKRQVVGVFASKWLTPLAQVLGRLGSSHCWIVHGDGLDELTTAGVSEVASLADGAVSSFLVRPGDAGLPTARIEDLAGGSPTENASEMRRLLAGAGGPIRDIVLLNAAAALIVAGRAGDLRGGVELAAASIDGGAALAALETLRRETA